MHHAAHSSGAGLHAQGLGGKSAVLGFRGTSFDFAGIVSRFAEARSDLAGQRETEGEEIEGRSQGNGMARPQAPSLRVGSDAVKELCAKVYEKPQMLYSDGRETSKLSDSSVDILTGVASIFIPQRLLMSSLLHVGVRGAAGKGAEAGKKGKVGPSSSGSGLRRDGLPIFDKRCSPAAETSVFTNDDVWLNGVLNLLGAQRILLSWSRWANSSLQHSHHPYTLRGLVERQGGLEHTLNALSLISNGRDGPEDPQGEAGDGGVAHDDGDDDGDGEGNSETHADVRTRARLNTNLAIFSMREYFFPYCRAYLPTTPAPAPILAAGQGPNGVKTERERRRYYCDAALREGNGKVKADIFSDAKIVDDVSRWAVVALLEERKVQYQANAVVAAFGGGPAEATLTILVQVANTRREIAVKRHSKLGRSA